MVVANGGPRPAPGTLTQLLFDAADRYDKPDAMQVKIGGRYEPISHRRMLERIRNLARGLQTLGVRAGDRVAILSENRPEWTIADFACLTSGVTDVAIYPTLPAQQIAYILRDSGAVAVFVSTREQAAKIAAVRAELPAIAQVIGFDDIERPLVDVSIETLERRGAEGAPPDDAARHREEALRVRPDDLATLIYTSGTTGEPKGVMLSHDNLYSNVAAVLDFKVLYGQDVALSFLPLSHVLERLGVYFLIAGGASIAFAESMDTVPANMLEVRPTIMFSVPRLYEKMYARVLESAAHGGAVKRGIFHWASGVADRCADIKLAGGTPGGLLAAQYALAQKLVFSKIRARTGGRMRYFVSGGAPLAPDIAKFFYAAGLTILEGYGLTETSPVITANRPDALRMGTVGMPIEGVSVAIADDGEILTRGPNVMKGYYNRPDATADAIDADGWFHTGDIGELRDGFLAITDRKKEIIVTAGGKNIAPQPIENRVKNNKFVSQAVLIGDKRRFPLVLIVPDFDHLEKWAAYKTLVWTSRDQLVAIPEVQAKMEREVLVPLSDLAHYEMPRKVVLLPQDFSLEAGELTPTLKVKRRVIDARYRHLIDAVYEHAAVLATTQAH